MIAYAMAKTSYSGEMVCKNKEVILTIPGTEIADAVMGCGISTGRDTDKACKFGIEMQTVPDSEIQIPLRSCVAIQCSLKQFIETGGHYLYICNADQVYGTKDERAVFSWNRYTKIAPANQE